MKIRVKVYDTAGKVYNRLDLSVASETNIPDVLNDVDEFLRDQYGQLIEEGEEE